MQAPQFCSGFYEVLETWNFSETGRDAARWPGQGAGRNWSPILREIPPWKQLRCSTLLSLLLVNNLMKSQGRLYKGGKGAEVWPVEKILGVEKFVGLSPQVA